MSDNNEDYRTYGCSQLCGLTFYSKKSKEKEEKQDDKKTNDMEMQTITYSCPLCCVVFSTEEAVQKHVKYYHKENNQQQ